MARNATASYAHDAKRCNCVLLCTNAAAEGTNFLFCGALVNYDMPWNPMRVEQRIGRIDCLGQKCPNVLIINLHYANTVEAIIYRALRDRIGMFESVVGRLQPILASLPSVISGRVLQGKTRPADDRDTVAEVAAVTESADAGFDIDAVTAGDLVESLVETPSMTMDDLEQVLRSPTLMPSGIEVEEMGAREFKLRAPGIREWVRVTTNPAYYEQHADAIGLWSPGDATFPALRESGNPVVAARLSELLQP